MCKKWLVLFLGIAPLLHGKVNDQYYKKHFIDEIPPQEVEGKTFFLSFLRSGTNLMINFYQHFSKRAFMHVNHQIHGPKSTLGTNRLRIALDEKLDPIYRTHYPKLIKDYDRSVNSLVFILRDFHEAVVREAMAHKTVPRGKKLSRFEEEAVIDIFRSEFWDHYKQNLEIFDSWDKDRRVMVHYEALVRNPINEILKIAHFMGDSPDVIKQLQSNRRNHKLIEDLKKKILVSYSREQRAAGGSKTRGDLSVSYLSGLSDEAIREIEEIVRADSGELWGKYLKAYARF